MLETITDAGIWIFVAALCGYIIALTSFEIGSWLIDKESLDGLTPKAKFAIVVIIAGIISAWLITGEGLLGILFS